MADTTRDIIWNHIDSIRVCMLVTHDGARVRSRPMRCIPRPDQNAIWFIADRDMMTDDEVRRDPGACLTFADVGRNTYVSVSGRIARVEDPAMARDLCGEDTCSYFPEMEADPRLMLFRFDPESGEYWDSPSSKIILAIRFLEARITGERPNLGSNAKTKL